MPLPAQRAGDHHDAAQAECATGTLLQPGRTHKVAQLEVQAGEVVVVLLRQLQAERLEVVLQSAVRSRMRTAAADAWGGCEGALLAAAAWHGMVSAAVSLPIRHTLMCAALELRGMTELPWRRPQASSTCGRPHNVSTAHQEHTGVLKRSCRHSWLSPGRAQQRGMAGHAGLGCTCAGDLPAALAIFATPSSCTGMIRLAQQAQAWLGRSVVQPTGGLHAWQPTLSRLGTSRCCAAMLAGLLSGASAHSLCQDGLQVRLSWSSQQQKASCGIHACEPAHPCSRLPGLHAGCIVRTACIEGMRARFGRAHRL